MTQASIKIRCSRCMGTGIDDNLIIPGPCDGCGGDGWHETDVIDTTEVMEELNWIKNKIKKILKKLDIEE